MAMEVLNNAQGMSHLSDSLKSDIINIMKPVDATEGHCFVKEGETIRQFIIVESGTLSRYKTSVGGGSDNDSIQIDEIGAGKVTGFLHVAGHQDDDKAFADIVAGKGGAKVWTVSGNDFRALMEDPKHSMEIIKTLTLTLRQVTKLARATLKETSGGSSLDMDTHQKVLKIMCYDTTSWVRENFEPQISSFNESQATLKIQMDFTQDRLDLKTAKYAAGYDAVCLFVNDKADSEVMWILSMGGVKLIAMRCAGFDRVDSHAAQTFGISVARVPAYSPYAVAEHAISLLMSVNRKIPAASTRVKMANFTLDSGLLGMDIHGKTVGVMGTGKIGQILCRIVNGFGAKLLAYDVFESDEVKSMGGTYVSKEEIYKQSDVIFLMMPLLPATKHTLNAEVLPLLKKGVIIINTSRGGLIDTSALINGLQSGIIGGCGLDVYENEGEYFFQDWSAKNIEDTELVSLLGNNKVVLTAHQAFFTREAIDKIISTTIDNFSNFSSGLRGKDLPNSVF